MTHQLRQSFEREAVRPASGAVRQSTLQGFQPRNLQPADQLGVGDRRRMQQAVAVERRGVHVAIVAAPSAEMEGNGRRATPETDRNSSSAQFLDLNAAVRLALARIGMLEKVAAGRMGISAGTFSKQLSGFDNCHVQLDKLAMLPEEFHVEFARIYAERVGLKVSHQTIARLLLARVGQLLALCGDLAEQLEQAS